MLKAPRSGEFERKQLAKWIDTTADDIIKHNRVVVCRVKGVRWKVHEIQFLIDPLPHLTFEVTRRERRDSVESDTSGGSEGRQSLWIRSGFEKDLLEGDYTLICNKNYDQFLAAVGAGPLSSNMVLRAKVNLSIKEVNSFYLNLSSKQKGWRTRRGADQRSEIT